TVEASSRTYGINIAGQNNIVVDGFEVMYQNNACVRIFNATGVTVKNVSAQFAGTYGIRVDSTDGPITVSGCKTSNSVSNGILLTNAPAVLVENSEAFHSGFHGISLQGSSNNQIIGNVSRSNFRFNVRSATGIDISALSSNNVIRANTVYDNQDAGVQVYS